MTLARRCDCGKQDGEEEGCCRRVIGHLGEEETRLHQGELIKRAQGGGTGSLLDGKGRRSAVEERCERQEYFEKAIKEYYERKQYFEIELSH